MLLLDEMTAALPADLTARVLEVVGRRRADGHSVIFISHRLLEIAALCDRATVLRDGRTVGVVDMTTGAEDRIVELMLGPAREERAAEPVATPASPRPPATAPPRASRCAACAPARKLHDVSFELHAGRGAGRRRARGPGPGRAVRDPRRRAAAGRRRAAGRRPARCASGIPPTRSGQAWSTCPPTGPTRCCRSARCARTSRSPRSRRPSAWGLVNLGRERSRVQRAIERLQIDTRVSSEVRRLSGGNQQKVTIARWIAGGVETLLCFDPTRGIDIRTKREIYQLVRDLAAAGAAVLLYTSELDEIQRACDRAIVMFNGRVVGEMPAAEADEPTLVRAAHGITARAAAASGRGGRRSTRMTAATRSAGREARRGARSQACCAGCAATRGWSASGHSSSACCVFTKLIRPAYGADRPRLARHRRPSGRLRRGRAGGRRDLRRDRPVDRLDDGADQRHRRAC